jgi:sodium-coupled neutral amino acid transporter 11
VCHHNSFMIYGSLKRPTLDRWNLVTHLSTGISCVLSLAMALSGYLIFGQKTEANILNNFGSNNLVINIARFAFATNMFTTFPLECFVCREVIENYFFRDSTIQYVLLFKMTAVYRAFHNCHNYEQRDYFSYLLNGK